MSGCRSKVGYDPISVAGLPFKPDAEVDVDAVKGSFLADLRRVQKPERLAEFDRNRLPNGIVSHFEKQREQDLIKTGKQEPEGQTKNDKKRQENMEEIEKPTDHSVASKGPRHPSKSRNPEVALSDALDFGCPHLLSPKARNLLASFEHHQFFFCGERAPKRFLPKRQGFLDLYSGGAEVARHLSKKFGVWVLTFDYDRGAEQDLLRPELQKTLHTLVEEDAFYGVGAAPECCSFSRAVTPAVHSREEPLGLPCLTANMDRKVRLGNLHAAFVISILLVCIRKGLAYWCENPDGSFIWLLPDWLAASVGAPQFRTVVIFALTVRHGGREQELQRILTWPVSENYVSEATAINC